MSSFNYGQTASQQTPNEWYVQDASTQRKQINTNNN